MISDQQLYSEIDSAKGYISLDRVLYLISNNSRTVQYRDPQTGSLPLHNACHYRCNIKIISALVYAYPDALFLPDSHGLLPVHRAILTHQDGLVSEDVLYHITATCPESIRIPLSNDQWLIHYACTCKEYLSIIPLWIDLYPQSLLFPDSNGMLPIHHACIDITTIDIALLIISKCPECVRVSDSSKRLPIHIACESALKKPSYSNGMRSINLDVHSAFQNVIHQLSSPRHTKSYNYSSLSSEKSHSYSLIEALVSQYPDSLMAVDESNRIPLLIACLHSQPKEVILYLATKYPDGLKSRDTSWKLPLHILCTQKQYSSIIPDIIDLYPKSISIASSQGNLPIHDACSGVKISSEIVLYMISRNPDTLTSRSVIYEKIPLQLVVSFHSNDRDREIVVREMVKLMPASVHISRQHKLNFYNEMKKYNGTSLDIAMDRWNSRGVIYRMLLNSSPQYISDTIHIENYYSLNWEARKPLFLTLSRPMSIKSNANPRQRVIYSISKHSDWKYSNSKEYVFLHTIVSYL